MGRFALSTLKRGDIIIANFEPVRGSEQCGVRPALIIQNDEGNLHSPIIIVAAITSKIDKRNYPINVLISKKDSKLPKDSLVLCNQIRSIDKLRITKRISGLNPYLMSQVDTAIKISLGLDD